MRGTHDFAADQDGDAMSIGQKDLRYLRISYFLYFLRMQNSGVAKSLDLLKFQICCWTNMKPSKLKNLLSLFESQASTCLLNLPAGKQIPH